MLAARTPKNTFFFEEFYRGHHLPHPRRGLYTPPVHPYPLQRTRADCTAQVAGQAVRDDRDGGGALEGVERVR